MAIFLEDAWYVGAWSDELSDKPVGRTLLGTPVVFYRKADGKPVAMHDRCPHRFVKLSSGTVEGDEIKCAYHGLTFNEGGKCTHHHANDIARERFTLRTFPLVERYHALWIWMGDPAKADPALIPDFNFFNEPTRMVAGKGLTYIKANYLLEIDNLLDLSHLDFVHANTISNKAVTQADYKVYQKGDTVHSDRWISGYPAPVQFQDLIRLTQDEAWSKARRDMIVDHWLDMRWDAPGTLFLDVGVAPEGANREGAIDMAQAHWVTPETEYSTHYFWIYTMPVLGQPQALIDGFLKVVHIAFDDEDKPMIEAQQAAMKSADFWAEQPMIISEDAGAIRARRVLEKRIRAENRSQASEALAEAG